MHINKGQMVGDELRKVISGKIAPRGRNIVRAVV